MALAPPWGAAALVSVLSLPAGAQTWTVHIAHANSVWTEYER